MNQIIIVLFLIFFLGSKNDNIKNILANISLEDVLPILQMLGINENTLQAVNTLLPSLLKGNFDIQTLIKTVMPLISTLSKNSTKSDISADENLSALEPFAPREVIDGMRDYFE